MFEKNIFPLDSTIHFLYNRPLLSNSNFPVWTVVCSGREHNNYLVMLKKNFKKLKLKKIDTCCASKTIKLNYVYWYDQSCRAWHVGKHYRNTAETRSFLYYITTNVSFFDVIANFIQIWDCDRTTAHSFA